MLSEHIVNWIIFLVTGFGACALSILTHKALIKKNTLWAVLALLVSIMLLIRCIGTGTTIIQRIGDDPPVCPECGIRVETPYCTSCGAIITEEAPCLNCGQELTAGDTYCGYCGVKTYSP